AFEDERARIELGPGPALHEAHLDVVQEALFAADPVPFDALDDEAGSFVHPDRAIVVADHAQADAMEAQLTLQVPQLERERLAPEVLAPEPRLADADADLDALPFRVVVAVIGEADRLSLVLDHPASRLAGLRHALDPLARVRLFEAARLHAPLEPPELGVAPPSGQIRQVRHGHRPEGHALPAHERDARDLAHDESASAADVTRSWKSAGSAFVSRSAMRRARRSSSFTPRSSSPCPAPRRRTDTVPATASLSPTTSMYEALRCCASLMRVRRSPGWSSRVTRKPAARSFPASSSAYGLAVSRTGMIAACSQLSHSGKFPAKCLMRPPTKRSRLPKSTRWIITARSRSPFSLTNVTSKRSGRFRSIWIVGPCHSRPIASMTLMSIFGA